MKHERRHSSSGFRDDAVQQGAIGCKLKHSGIGTSNPHGERHSWIVSIRRRVVGYVRESRVRAALPFGQVWRPWRCAAARARECNLAGAWGVRRGRTHLPLGHARGKKNFACAGCQSTAKGAHRKDSFCMHNPPHDTTVFRTRPTTRPRTRGSTEVQSTHPTPHSTLKPMRKPDETRLHTDTRPQLGHLTHAPTHTLSRVPVPSTCCTCTKASKCYMQP